MTLATTNPMSGTGIAVPAATPVTNPQAMAASRSVVPFSPPIQASQPLQFVLPSGCQLVQPAAGVSVAICQQASPSAWERWGPSLPSVLSLVISVLAVGFTFRTYRYNKDKDQRSRLQSIQDDYWLRKVISPNTIEPFLKFTTELRSGLPVVSAGGAPSPEEVQQFWSDSAKRLVDFSSAFRMLELLDRQLQPAIEKCIEGIDEVLASYCGAVQAQLSNGDPAPDRHAAIQRIVGFEAALFRSIQTHQTSVGHSQPS